jgi:hypothetical protein
MGGEDLLPAAIAPAMYRFSSDLVAMVLCDVLRPVTGLVPTTPSATPVLARS